MLFFTCIFYASSNSALFQPISESIFDENKKNKFKVKCHRYHKIQFKSPYTIFFLFQLGQTEESN